MITVKEAEALIMQHTCLAETSVLAIENLSNEVLREPLMADRCHPPFDRVAMDGIAININAYEKGQTTFSIMGCQKAGTSKQSLEDMSGCFEVMTGAILPEGCNTVIRYEDVNIEHGIARVNEGLVLAPYHNVHMKGSDYGETKEIVPQNQSLLAPHWGVAATIGKAKVLVSRRPKIAVISTGDELVSVDVVPLEHQIRKSNCYSLLASLRSLGNDHVELVKLNDDEDELYSSTLPWDSMMSSFMLRTPWLGRSHRPALRAGFRRPSRGRS
jgi:molybdopterin molybdotransferase